MSLLEGKTVLIAGATQGIGLAAAIGLGKEKPRLVVVGRDAGRTHDALERIKAASGHADVSALLADVSSLEQIRRLAAEFTAKHDRLHVLVNNAGAFFPERGQTADGYEQTFAVDHLAPFLRWSGPSCARPRKAPRRRSTSPPRKEVAQVSGKYFIDKREAKTTAAAQNMELAKRLWEASEALVAPKSAAKVA